MVSYSEDHSSSPLMAAVANSPTKLRNSSHIKEDANLLLCFEEVDYQDESSEEEMAPEVVSDTSSCSAQFYVPSTPSNTVLFSPNTPWLTSASPHIGNGFNFSPPMQVLQQTTPKLHHLSPPLPSPVITGYGPCITLPGSPQFFPMFDAGQRPEFHFFPGECTCNVQH